LEDLKRKIKLRFLKYQKVRDTVRWAKTTSFEAFKGVPVYDILVFVINEAKKDDIIVRANAIAYSFFLALFPSLIFLITILPYVTFVDLTELLFDFMQQFIPQTAENFLFQTMEDLLTIPREGLLSLGALLAIFFSSNGMLALMDGFEKSYESAFRFRSFWKKRIIALQLTVIFGLGLFISALMIVVSNLFLNYFFNLLEINNYVRFAIYGTKWIIIMLMLYSMIAMIYKYGPATKTKFKFLSPGATVATLGTILASLGFSFFVNSFGTYNKIYGSIGAVIVTMVWIQLISFIILVGFELNTAIAINKNLKSETDVKENT
jgi:membrane protein